MALHGTSKAYIIKRLKDQGESELLAAVEAGKITAFSAAISLGWVRKSPGKGGSTHKAKRIQHQLRAITGQGLSAGQKMELIYGPNSSLGSLFKSREELVQAWAACRDELLTADEKAELEREWKAAFQEAQPDDFTLNDGGGEILRGDCARAAHYAHHDIPRELLRRWEKAERRRRARHASWLAARGEQQPVAPSAGPEEAAAIK